MGIDRMKRIHLFACACTYSSADEIQWEQFVLMGNYLHMYAVNWEYSVEFLNNNVMAWNSSSHWH